VIDVTDARAANARELQRAARDLGYWPIRRCYEEGLRRNQRLGGEIRLALSSAGEDTGAIRATVVATTLADESVTLCVAREMKRLALWPVDSELTASVAVALSTGDEPVPLPAPAPHAGALREGLRAAWPGMQQCYEAELTRQPDGGGRIELRFRARGGEVLEVDERDVGFGSNDFTQCVLGVARDAKLAVPRDAPGETKFGYSLHFEAEPQNASPAAK
jgi:hypothetical protein